MKPYFFPDPEHQGRFFGSSDPVCVDAREVRRLARDWDMDAAELFAQLHEASDAEAAAYGTYDTPTAPADKAMLFGEAAQTDDRDAFVSDWALSSFWGDPEDAEIPAERIEMLRWLWRLAHMDIGEICCFAKISMTELSQRTLIPYRTLQNRAGGHAQFRTADRYLLLHFLGLLPDL